jgi:hypothetical protein
LVAPITPLQPDLTETPDPTAAAETDNSSQGDPLTPTQTAIPGDTTPSKVGSPNLALVWGMIVSLVLVIGVLAYRQFSRN